MLVSSAPSTSHPRLSSRYANCSFAPWQPAAVLWTADATFGDHKYNYYKLVPDTTSEATLIESPTEDTWQIDDAAYAYVDGVKHSVEITPLCSWASTITDASRNSDSIMENRLCHMVLRRANAPPVYGLAYNERCYGTVG